MNRENVKREWFGAVRSIAESSGKKLKEESVLTPVQAVKLDILLRQYLCDGLADLISESEKVSTEEANNLQKDIYSELIEDAIAGVWSETENMETAMFLFDCTKGVRTERRFSALLKEILSGADSEGTQALMTEMDKDITEFSEKRKALRQPKKSSSDDEPPPWMDEFEYIDWVITH